MPVIFNSGEGLGLEGERRGWACAVPVGTAGAPLNKNVLPKEPWACHPNKGLLHLAVWDKNLGVQPLDV